MRRLSILVTMLFVLGGVELGCGDGGPDLEEEPPEEGRDAGSTDSGAVDGGEASDADAAVDTGADVDPADASETSGGDTGADTGPETEDTGGCPDLEPGTASCSEPSSCPEFDDSKDPNISCFAPEVVSASESSVTLELYGEHLSRGERAPERLGYSLVGGAATYKSSLIEVHSPCHVSVEMDLAKVNNLSCRNTLKFRLVRSLPDSTSDDYDRTEAKTIRVAE